MFKVDLKKINYLMNYDKYINIEDDFISYTDTDSMFIYLNEIGLDKISLIEKFVNEKVVKIFSKLHNSNEMEKEDILLPFHFKNEMKLKNIIFYKKKKYLAIIDENGNLIPEIKGLEGKKATSPFIENILNDLIDALKNDIEIDLEFIRNKWIEYVEKIINISSFKEAVKLLPQPVNIQKKVYKLKTLSSMHKGTLVFDEFIYPYWEKQVGKGFHLYIKFKPGREIEYSQKIENLIKKYKELNIKIEKKTIDDLIKDITIPDEFLNNDEILNQIENIFEINIKNYLKILKKKFFIFYEPLAKNYLYLFQTNRKIKPNMLLYNNNVRVTYDVFNNENILEKFLNYYKNNKNSEV